MQKKILVFTNGEKIGDAIIKLPLLNEIKKRLPDHKLIWMTNKGKTSYNKELKNIANEYIDEILEQANLNVFFWKKISNKYDLSKVNYEYIFDTQKTFFRTLALKRISCDNFISASTAGFFSSRKIIKKNNSKRKYYLYDLYDLLDLIKKDKVDSQFTFKIPNNLSSDLRNLFKLNEKYIGIAPGAGEKNKIWDLKNFIKVAKYFEKKSYKLVFFLGPDEKNIEKEIKSIFPSAILPENSISNYSGTEIVIASTKFLRFSISNDSGVSHMLSSGFCPLIKLFGPKDSNKFTPRDKKIITISSDQFGSKNINDIPIEYVLKKIEEEVI